jgi:hypothetical protein
MELCYPDTPRINHNLAKRQSYGLSDTPARDAGVNPLRVRTA